MNAAGLPDGSWSRTRWAMWISFAFLFQLAFIQVLSLHRPLKRRAGEASGMTMPRMVEPTLQVLSELRNPTVLSLGDAHGFQSIWMTSAPPSPLDAASKEEPAWLEVDRDWLG